MRYINLRLLTYLLTYCRKFDPCEACQPASTLYALLWILVSNSLILGPTKICKIVSYNNVWYTTSRRNCCWCGKYKCTRLTYNLLLHSLASAKMIFFLLHSTESSIKQLFFNHFHSIHSFKTVNYWTLLDYITVRVESDFILPVSAASVSEMVCIPAAHHCGSADRIVPQHTPCLFCAL